MHCRPLRFSLLLLLLMCLQLPSLIAEAQGLVRVIRTPHGGIQPQTAVDSRGVIHLIYFDGDPAAGDLFYVHSNDRGKTFSDPIRVNGGEDDRVIAMGNIRGAHLAIGKGDRPHVAWMGASKVPAGHGLAPQHPMLYTRLDDSGQRFEPPRNLMRTTKGLDGGGSIAADSSGRVYVAWHGSAADAPEAEIHRTLFVAISRDGGETFGAERVVDPDPQGACACCGMRAMADGDRVYLLYRTAGMAVNRDMRLVWSGDGAETFEAETVATWRLGACPMSSSTMAVANDQLILGYESQQAAFMSIRSESDPAAKRNVPVIEANPSGKHPVVAANTTGTVLMAWVEGMSWGQGGRLRYDLFDATGNRLRSLMQTGPIGIPAWSLPTAAALPDGSFIIFR